MKLLSQDLNGVTLITTTDRRIDTAVAIQFKDEMRKLTQNTSGRVLLDLSSVDFLDSSGLGAVVAAMKQMPQATPLELCGLTPTVAKVFRLTRMDSVFEIFDTVELAIGQAHAS